MDTEWPFVFLGLAIGVALGSGGAAFFHNRAHDAGSQQYKEKSDAKVQPITKAIAPTLSEVQHAYAAQFSLHGALRRQGHEAVTLEKRGPHASPANKAALAHAGPPSRQKSSYGKFLAWSLEHAPSWELHATEQDILPPPKRHLASQDLQTDTSLKRTFTSTELAATLSSPDSFDRVAVDYVLGDTGNEQEHERKGLKRKPGGGDVPTLMPASSVSRTEGSQRIMVWRSSSLDQNPSYAEAASSMDLAIDSSRETFGTFGADLSAPSMTNTSTSREAQLFDLALDDDITSNIITPLASLTTTDEALWQDSLKQATIAILLKLEEILPRPNEGLLKRMVRLSDVVLLALTEDGSPTLQLKAGAEYRVALQILPSPQRRPRNVRHMVKWVKMHPNGCSARTMQVLQEGNGQEQVWTGACVWMTDRLPKSQLHHDDGQVHPIAMSLRLGKEMAGGEEEQMCLNVQLHATFDAVRGSWFKEYDTTGPLNAVLSTWEAAPERLFSNTSDIILCKF